MSARLLAFVLVLLGVPEAELNLADLEGYRAALAPSKETPVPVTFRALWEHPERFEGRRVGVTGRVERLFRQGPIGDFPALEEAWAVSPAFDPFCLVYPKPEDGRGPRIGSNIRFSGTFLKLVRYESGDGPRKAPLIVGDRPPEAIPDANPIPPMSINGIDWALGIGAALFVSFMLVRQYLGRPRPVPKDETTGPHPEFLGPGDEA